MKVEVSGSYFDRLYELQLLLSMKHDLTKEENEDE